ncbi:hypothetical protein [Nonomuraea sp. NPDC002799]
MTHRPLSNWVASVRGPELPTVTWEPVADVNDGDERADARHLTTFTDGWQRRRFALDLGYGALGLIHRRTGQAVVELSETSRPIAVTPAGVALIDRIEEHWPEADLDSGDLDVLGNEDLPLRHLLLSRLADEGHPRAELFHLLPWHLVSELAGQVIAALRGSSAGPDVRLRHWFTPAGSRFTAALDQLGAGLRARNAAVVRAGGTALCARLLELDVRRVPRSTRRVLRRLLRELVARDHFLTYWAERASASLLGEGEAGADEPALRLRTSLPAAAESQRGVRRHSRRLRRDPFVVDLTVTGTGRLEVGVEAGLTAGHAAAVAATYQVMVLRLEVRTGDAGQTYVIPLQRLPGALAGAITVPLRTGETEIEYDVGLTGPPIGVTEARLLAPEDVRRSLRAVRTRMGLRPWQDLADALPAGHVLRSMVDDAIGRTR